MDKLNIMRHSGGKLAELLKLLKSKAKPGITTKKLDQIAQQYIDELNGFKASFKNYRGYPASICASINDEVVHGVPSTRILTEGDILSIDAGLYYEGYHVDAAVTFSLGNISQKAQKLINCTEYALKKAIDIVKEGTQVAEISRAIQQTIEAENFNVVRKLTGHGVGKKLHQAPEIPCFVPQNQNETFIKTGEALAIEVMATAGDYSLIQDSHAFKTKDGSLSAHFEHTIYVTKTGCEVLTGNT